MKCPANTVSVKRVNQDQQQCPLKTLCTFSSKLPRKDHGLDKHAEREPARDVEVVVAEPHNHVRSTGHVHTVQEGNTAQDRAQVLLGHNMDLVHTDWSNTDLVHMVLERRVHVHTAHVRTGLVREVFVVQIVPVGDMGIACKFRQSNTLHVFHRVIIQRACIIIRSYWYRRT